jgi:hypothetical protein
VAARGAKPPSDAEGTRKLHLIVGRSLFLNFPERLRRVYVSNPVVLDSIASSPFELVITARRPAPAAWCCGAWRADKMFTVLADVDVAGLRQSRWPTRFPAIMSKSRPSRAGSI